MTCDIRKPFARNGKVDEQDVRSIKRSLNWLGYYTPYKKTGMTELPDAQVFDALKSFQKDNALPVTGTLKPGDETHKTLQKNMDSTHYIWRSVRDDRSRGEHAKRHGQVFSWDNPPEDGHPGEASNCRCWAEPLQKTDCEGFLREIRVLEDEINKQTSKLNKLHLHNENLIRDNNELVKDMQLQLGYNIAAYIIDYPFKKIPLLAEMTRERFGGLVGEKILDKADQMSKELHAIRERKHYNDEQIELFEHSMTQLEQNKEKLHTLYQHCIEEPSVHV